MRSVTRQTVSGTPTSELYEPCGATVSPSAARTAPRRSFVLVLPEDPVILTTQLRQAVDQGPAQRDEGGLGVLDDDARQPVDGAGGQGGARAALGGLGHVGVPVGVLADAGDVEAAGGGLTGVGDDRAVDDDGRVAVDGAPVTWASSARVRAIIGPPPWRGR